MKQFKIKNTKSGNCACRYCGKYQEGNKLQLFTVWWKEENEKEGIKSQCAVSNVVMII